MEAWDARSHELQFVQAERQALHEEAERYYMSVEDECGNEMRYLQEQQEPPEDSCLDFARWALDEEAAQQAEQSDDEAVSQNPSDSDSQEALSDDEDIFLMDACPLESLPAKYAESTLERKRLAIESVASLLRSEPLLPLHHDGTGQLYKEIGTALLIPSWHCPFKGCTSCGLIRSQKSDSGSQSASGSILVGSNHVRDLWRHIWGDPQEEIPGHHKRELTRIVDKSYPHLRSSRRWWERREMALSLLEEAVAELCRENVPLLGLATDRRVLGHVSEVVQEANLKTLMCFVCNTKHVFYHGLNKYGQEYNAGRIDYRVSPDDREKLQELLCEDSKFFINNLCYKRFKGLYGEAVSADEHLKSEDSWEWRRRIPSKDGKSGEALCNPEDVIPSPECKHDPANEICSLCAIPICNECWGCAKFGKNIAKTMANDNYIGYMCRYFVEHEVGI